MSELRPKPIRIATLTAVHNRRVITLRCLKMFFKEVKKLEHGFFPSVQFKMFLVDDGSSDGTADAVANQYPEVQVIRGDGSLFWNNGMRLAWETASLGSFDAYLWVNDDIVLLPDALVSLVKTFERQHAELGISGIVVGSCRAPLCDESEGAVPFLTYGGRDKHGLVHPRNTPVPVMGFNGNLVLVSQAAYKKLGNLSSAYRHGFGDIDYGVRAVRAGIPIWLAPGYLAECDRNPPPKWRDPGLPLRERIRAIKGPKGICPAEIRHFQRVIGTGWWVCTVIRFLTYVLFPGLVPKQVQSMERPRVKHVVKSSHA